jgi:hypothetical protein
MLALLAPIIGLATESLKLINSKEATKYIDQMVKLKMNIMNEEAKGYNSDDVKIEKWYKELKIVLEAVQQEVALHAAKRG